jgi:hypothetical protein
MLRRVSENGCEQVKPSVGVPRGIIYPRPMNGSETAAGRLDLGDEVDRLAVSGGLAHAAAQLGISLAAAQKARWLAHVYGQAERTKIGSSCLQALSPSHLEAAFPAGPARIDLLKRAAVDSLSVRDTRALAQGTADAPVNTPCITVIGAASDLSSASASLIRYAQWDDNKLAVLLAGPNGDTIRTLALAGRALSDRLGLAG